MSVECNSAARTPDYTANQLKTVYTQRSTDKCTDVTGPIVFLYKCDFDLFRFNFKKEKNAKRKIRPSICGAARLSDMALRTSFKLLEDTKSSKLDFGH